MRKDILKLDIQESVRQTVIYGVRERDKWKGPFTDAIQHLKREIVLGVPLSPIYNKKESLPGRTRMNTRPSYFRIVLETKQTKHPCPTTTCRE